MPSKTKRITRLTPSDLDALVLKSGNHDRRSMTALCVMEAVAWFAGREHTDHPPCASPTIAAFLRSWNDGMNDADRQMLKPLIPRVVNTVGTAEQEMQRAWMVLDWYCRISAPAWLRLDGLQAEAEAVEATAPIVDSPSATAAQRALSEARQAASAAGDAAWDAAGDAAWAKLRPTVELLQVSALTLIDRMIAVTPGDAAALPPAAPTDEVQRDG